MLLLATILLTTIALSSCRRGVASVEPRALPSVMVWAWHGRHELEFLDPQETGVAFLAGTVRVSGASVALLPGSETIDVRSGTVLLPVVRIEVDPGRPADLGERQLGEVTAGVLGFYSERFPGLQLDFDATRSQRDFYTTLLANVRRAIGESFLSVTALPSWCIGDPWLPAKLVDELVPMVYRMGPDAELVRARLDSGRDFVADCRSALGISADEPVPALPPRRRLYLFSDGPWSVETYEQLLVRTVAGTETRDGRGETDAGVHHVEMR